jgi:CubicO group peptidase (beta-lactamase class C family)
MFRGPPNLVDGVATDYQDSRNSSISRLDVQWSQKLDVGDGTAIWRTSLTSSDTMVVWVVGHGTAAHPSSVTSRTSSQLMFGTPSARRAIAVGAVLLALVTACSHGHAAHPAVSDSAQATRAPVLPALAPYAAPTPMLPPDAAPTPDFAAVSKLMNDAIAAHKLPGAVVVIGHGGNVVVHQAYGSRKLAGELGLDGSPAPAEPMTEDTIFDVASLTKSLATATGVMQLYEQGKVHFDDPVQKYLPDFNPSNDSQRAKVTVRMLLTHTSGETGDVDLKDPWGLDRADKTEGIRRALTAPLQSGPGEVFRYSDINFILLGALIEKVTGDAEDVYVQQHVFAPLGMQDTRYLPPAKACGPHKMRGAAIAWAPASTGRVPVACPAGTWSTSLLSRVAPTARDDESRADPGKNPDIDYLLRGTVHDTTARRMGGVAGHAGVFSTTHDVSIYAQALLDRLAGRPSEFPLKQATLELMTTPQQPGHSAQQLDAANDAAREAVATRPNTTDPLLAPNYPAIKGQNLRGFGWDIDTAQSTARGIVFPIGSFGHTGFTGTSLWMDPGSNTYVVLLANSIHTRGSPPMSTLRGEVATATAQALRLYGSG